MNVRTKLRGAFAAYIALLAALSFYHVRTTRRAATSARELTTIAARFRSISTAQPARIAQIINDAQKYLVTHDTGYRAKVQETMRAYDGELRRLEGLQLSAKERAVMAPLTAEWSKAMEMASQLGAKPDAATLALFLESLGRVGDATNAVATATQDAMDEELNDSERSERAAEQLTVFIATTAVLLSILLSALLARSILDPLKRLAEGTREVSAGRFGHRLAARGNNELAQVAREFNSMTERLSELDQMKQEFVSKVSHDLKTPLSSMQETNGVMLDEVPGPLTPKQRQLLEINQDSARRLSAMLNKLLDLSRVEAGLDIERQMLDVRMVVRRSVRRIMEGSLGDRVSLSLADSADRLLVRGDPDALSQVFDNLLDNAIKFSAFDSQVRVRVADLVTRGDIPADRWGALRKRGFASGAVLVTVSDLGPGIPDEEKERVFQRFYQTEAGRAVRGRGVGLGLAICREIVTAHGGAMWVSDNEPRGSVFNVLLPGAGRADAETSSRELTTDGAHRA